MRAMRRWLTIALGGLVLSCQGPAAVLAGEGAQVVRLASVETTVRDPGTAVKGS